MWNIKIYLFCKNNKYNIYIILNRFKNIFKSLKYLNIKNRQHIKIYFQCTPQSVSGKIHTKTLRTSNSGYVRLVCSQPSHQKQWKICWEKSAMWGTGDPPK